MPPFETIYVDTMIAACDGGGGPLGHPKVYLNLAGAGRIECPYCSRLFVYVAKPEGYAVETPAPGAPVSEARAADHPPPAAPEPAP